MGYGLGSSERRSDAAETTRMIDVDLIGEERLTSRCHGIGIRCLELRPVFEGAMQKLEQDEKEFFGEKYVLTGALRDSLTTSGSPDAIRRVTNSALEFGSSLYYAKFQVEDPGPVTPA